MCIVLSFLMYSLFSFECIMSVYIMQNLLYSVMYNNKSCTVPTHKVTLTRCNFTESVTWFGWYMGFENDDIITFMMMSWWIFIYDILGLRLFICHSPLTANDCLLANHQCAIAHGTQKHKTHIDCIYLNL